MGMPVIDPPSERESAPVKISRSNIFVIVAEGKKVH
jgi:hypothetical protein